MANKTIPLPEDKKLLEPPFPTNIPVQNTIMNLKPTPESIQNRPNTLPIGNTTNTINPTNTPNIIQKIWDARGDVTGFVRPDGTAFLGNARDLRASVASEDKAQQGRDLARGQNEMMAMQEQAMASQKAVQQLGTQVEPSVQLDQGDVGTTAALSAISLLSGAGAGARLGTALGPVGIAGGAVVGGLTAFLGKLSIDKRQATKEAYQVFTTSSSKNYNQLLNAANNRLDSPANIVYLYNLNLANMREAERSLTKMTQGKVGKQLSGAQDELNKVRSWLANEPLYRAQLIAAMQNPNPNIMYQTENLNSVEISQ